MISYNRSSIYLFPLLFHSEYLKVGMVNKEENGFKMLNLYMADKTNPHSDIFHKNEDTLFMLLEVYDYDNEEFRYFIKNIENHPFYYTNYAVDMNKIMLVFKLNTESKLIFNLIKKGKYSKVPEIYRSFFISTAQQRINSCYNVLTKNPYLKLKLEQDLDVKLSNNAELDDIPYEQQETYSKE